jgi:hypothetical protein
MENGKIREPAMTGCLFPVCGFLSSIFLADGETKQEVDMETLQV